MFTFVKLLLIYTVIHRTESIPTEIIQAMDDVLYEISDYQYFLSLPEQATYTMNNGQPHPCSWLPACICRNESEYTNGTYMTMVNCTQSGLSEVPETIPSTTTVLTLDGNSIQNIKPGAFKNLVYLKYLDLSDNFVDTLSEGLFEGLENLRTLELSGNNIRYNTSSLPDSVFKPLKKLVRLNLHQKLNSVDENEKYPAKALLELKHLEQLLIDGIETENIATTFSFMTNLTTLDLSSEYGRCSLKKITANMFKGLNNITDLKISNCSLNYIENGSFSGMESLTNLDLSYNEKLHFKSLANITYGLQGKNITELKLVKIHETYGDCTRIEADHLAYFKDVQVDNVYLDNNRLAYVSEDAVQYIPRSIHKLSVTNNMLLAGEYIHEMFKQAVFRNLKYLTMAEQTMKFDALKFFNNKTRHMLKSIASTSNYSVNLGQAVRKDKENFRYEKEHQTDAPSTMLDKDSLPFCGNCYLQGISYDIILYIPKDLKDLDFSGLQIRNELKNICICEHNSLERLNLERNVFWSWQGPIGGLSNLLSLNLAWNSCDNLSHDVFDQMTSLIQLNLTRNFIERFLREDTEGRIFKYLKNLRSLVLIDNKITSLPRKLFQGLTSLSVLDLSYNFLTQINVEFGHTSPLRFLDLSNNLLNNIGSNIIEKFDYDRKMKFYSPYCYLDLSNNNLSCVCKDIDFVAWVSRTNVNLRGLNDYTCTYKNGKLKRLALASELHQELLKDCADYTAVIVCSCLGIIVFLNVSLGGIIYRYRWDMRYFYYSIKLKMNGNKLSISQREEKKYKYGAFISYANENALFVKNALVPELEDTRQLPLLVHDRDFELGEYVYDNIMQAIKSSRKTLILMSKNFLKSEWCIFEMNMARLEGIKTGRNVVCLVMLEEVPLSGLPLEILDIIREQTYLELPTDIQHSDMFWDRVHGALIN
ncbi:toll-like receptor 4 [Mercenaria mercenaria]|uniref:toll-like receptor 4 n=1 Tax=Mercenaria mercenaria TaxID=6596 RepID=UPI00234EB6C1|nr:toll-like receptor 4 [Mercenaria mercenaria]XP_053409034.1 toll-like receptor 4 [Mercenaria mercenaria]